MTHAEKVSTITNLPEAVIAAAHYGHYQILTKPRVDVGDPHPAATLHQHFVVVSSRTTTKKHRCIKKGKENAI
jgi:hypothetical protein